MKTSLFTSPSLGQLDMTQLRNNLLQYIKQSPQRSYRLIIGSDSQPKNGEGIDFITAIVVHRVGRGGIYFWRRTIEKRQMVLRSRIYQEAALSLTTAEELLDVLRADGISKFDLEIHVDIGLRGETRDMIAEVVGMIRGSGFRVKTKPDSYGASKVADRHT